MKVFHICGKHDVQRHTPRPPVALDRISSAQPERVRAPPAAFGGSPPHTEGENKALMLQA
jgi:hypothetical protein